MNKKCVILQENSPERAQVYFDNLQPHPQPPPDHKTEDIEAQRHCCQGGQGPGPGGGAHQLYQVQPGRHWLGVPSGQISKKNSILVIQQHLVYQ